MTFTKEQLARALEKWEEEASANEWSPRDDSERFIQAADYLWHLMEADSQAVTA